MDLARLDAAIADLQQLMGDDLLALDIWSTETGLSVAGVGLTPATGPMLQRLTGDLRRAGSAAGKTLDGYHVLPVANGMVTVIAGTTVDAALLMRPEVDLAWLLADVIPNFTEALDDVVTH